MSALTLFITSWRLSAKGKTYGDVRVTLKGETTAGDLKIPSKGLSHEDLFETGYIRLSYCEDVPSPLYLIYTGQHEYGEID